MRQIYTSMRLENVDRVVALLNAAGIATHLTHYHSYRGRSYQRFSYAVQNERDSWPAVWIVNAEDQVRARALMREAGLEPATRYSDELAAVRSTRYKPSHRAIAMRLRLIILSVVGGASMLLILHHVGIL